MNKEIMAKLIALFSMGNIAQSIKLTDTPVLWLRDMLYGKPKSHPFTTLSLAEFQKVTTAVPMVMNGDPYNVIGFDKYSGSLIRPGKFAVSMTAIADEADEVMRLTKENQNVFVNGMMETTKNSLTEYHRTMTALSLNGVISFPKKDGGSYNIDCTNGKGLTDVNVTTKITGATTPDELEDILIEMYNAFETTNSYNANGHNNTATFVSHDVFLIIKEIYASQNINLPKVIEKEKGLPVAGLKVGEFLVLDEAGKYKAPSTQALAYAIPSKWGHMVDLKAGHKYLFLAIKNFVHQFKSMPIGLIPTISPNGETLTVDGVSVPCAVPVGVSILKNQFLA